MADFANDSIEGLKTLLKLVEELKKELKDGAEAAAKLSKSISPGKARSKEIQELTNAQKELVIAQKELLAIEKKEIKIKTQLALVESGVTDEVIELKVKQQELNKVKKEEAKLNLGLINTYEKQSKKLNDLRKKYKSLRLEEGKNTKETKKLRKEIDKLDKSLKDVDAEAGQFQRQVGNYPKVANGAKRAFGSLSGFLLGIFVGSINKSRDAARVFQGTLEKTGNAIRIIAQEIIVLFTQVIIPATTNLFLKFESLSLKADEFFNGFRDTPEIQKRLKEIEKELDANTKAVDGYTFSWDELLDVWEKTDNNIDARLIRQDRLIDQTAILTNQIQKLAGEEAVLQSQIGDSTRSFKQRAELIDELIIKQAERLAKEKELAEAEFQNAATSIRNDLLRRKLISSNEDISDQNIKSLKFLDDKEKADAIGIDNLATLTAATSRLNAIEAETNLNRVEATKERLENARDLFEQELDFTLDIGDRQKSVNERIIASDKLTVKEKFKTLVETEALLSRSFKEQLRLTNGFIKDSLELNQELTGEEALKAVEALNLERIVGLEDEEEIRRALFDAGISDEITQNRIREIIIERKSALQDIVDLQEEINNQAKEEGMERRDALLSLRQFRKDARVENAAFETQQRTEDFQEEEKFNKAKFESAKAALELEEDAEVEALLFKKSIQIAEAELDNDKIRIAEELVQEELEIERRFLDASDDLDKDAADKKKARREKNQQEAFDFLKQITSALREELNKRNEIENEARDNQISETESDLQRQQELASQGLDNQLAFEKEKLNRLNLERKEALKKQQREEENIKLAETFLSLVEGFAQEDPNTAIPKALAGTFAARAVAKTFISAFEKGGLVEGDEQLIRINEKGQEFVVDADTTKAMGLSKTGSSMNDFHKIMNQSIPVDNIAEQSVYTKNIENKLDKLNETINNKPVPQWSADIYGNLILDMKRAGKNARTIFKMKDRL